MGTEKAACGWGCWACWVVGEEGAGGLLDGGSTSIALGSLMLERTERRFLSSGGRFSGWVLRSTLLRREEEDVEERLLGSVDWRAEVRDDLGLDSLCMGDACEDDFLLEPDGLLDGDFVGEEASD